MTTSFDALRMANIARLPEFKNKHGEPAHSKPDGSDWTPARWIQAMVGEIGELAEVRIDYQNGKIGPNELEERARFEAADAATYMDIASLRMLDDVAVEAGDPAELFLHLIKHLGIYANARKKFDRGDIGRDELIGIMVEQFRNVGAQMMAIRMAIADEPEKASQTVRAGAGFSLGHAVVDKFNAVSHRVGSGVRMDHFGGVEVLR